MCRPARAFFSEGKLACGLFRPVKVGGAAPATGLSENHPRVSAPVFLLKTSTVIHAQV